MEVLYFLGPLRKIADEISKHDRGSSSWYGRRFSAEVLLIGGLKKKRAGKNQPAHDNLLYKAFSIEETVACL